MFCCIVCGLQPALWPLSLMEYSMGRIDFYKELLHKNEQRKMLEAAMKQGAKEFADKLNEARENDALEFYEQARTSVSSLSEEDKLRTLCVLACNKLFDVGYREFALLFKTTLQRSEK